MTRFAIYERVQGSSVKTWECDARDTDAAKRIATKVFGRAPFVVTPLPTKPKAKKRNGRKK